MRDTPPLIVRHPQIVTAITGASALARGTSLIARPVDTISVLVATRFVPLSAWGLAFLSVTVLLWLALLIPPLRFGAHVAAVAVYSMYTLGVALAAVLYGSPWSSVGMLTVATAAHMLLARTYAPQGRPADG